VTRATQKRKTDSTKTFKHNTETQNRTLFSSLSFLIKIKEVSKSLISETDLSVYFNISNEVVIAQFHSDEDSATQLNRELLAKKLSFNIVLTNESLKKRQKLNHVSEILVSVISNKQQMNERNNRSESLRSRADNDEHTVTKTNSTTFSFRERDKNF
jgi:histidyl-tRNA synthetase